MRKVTKQGIWVTRGVAAGKTVFALLLLAMGIGIAELEVRGNGAASAPTAQPAVDAAVGR
jgi:hypothetical protein